MPKAELPLNELERLAVLRECGVLDTTPEQGFDDLTELASELCGTRIALVSLIDEQRQWFKSTVGLGVTQTCRESAFCAHAILTNAPLIIRDATQDPRTFDNPLVTGEPFIRFYAGVPLRSSEGLALGTLCVIDTDVRDISPEQLIALQRLARQAEVQLEMRRVHRQLSDKIIELRRQENLFETIFEESDNVMFVKDVAGRYRLFNPAFLRVVGKSRSDILNHDDTAIFDPEVVRAIRAVDLRVMQSGLPVTEEESLICDGVRRTFLTTKSIYHDGDRQVAGVIGIARDITERKRAEADLTESSRKSEAANRAKSEFLANMSHEIRTPLTAILGNTELLADDENTVVQSDSRRSMFATIKSAGEHLLEVVNDILDLSQIEAGQMRLERIETSLQELVTGVVALLRPRAGAKGLTLDLKLDSPIPARVLTDPTRLRQILMNLAGNAIKFTESGGITLRVSAHGQGAETILSVVVEDTGIGMNSDQTQRLFAAFSQADASVTRNYGGSGLGLVICQRLARLMGGNVELTRTAPGQGSVFTATLQTTPIASAGTTSAFESQAPAVLLTPPIHSSPRLQGRILLAEDSLDNQLLISTLLRNAGADVSVAAHGGIAFEMREQANAEGRPYNLLLTDMQMPVMDGYTLTRSLRHSGCDLPIVAITANAMTEDRQVCLDAGCNDFLSKPIDKQALLKTCETWLKRLPG